MSAARTWRTVPAVALLVLGASAGPVAEAAEQPTAPSAVAARPGPTNTGVPAGTSLKPYYGTLTVTTAGAVYDGLDIHGFVDVRAPNVTIRRSIIRGGTATGHSIGIVTNTKTTRLLVEDSEIVPEHPSVYIDGVQGANYTLSRVNIHGTVDGAKVFGDNVRIAGSWIHALSSYASDPYQGGGATHNDDVQVLGGRSIRITQNTLTDATNSALQVTQDHSATTSLQFDGNWADNGKITVNLANKPLGSMSGITVNDNHFGRHSTLNCPILATSAISLSAYGNTYQDDGSPVAVRRYG